MGPSHCYVGTGKSDTEHANCLLYSHRQLSNVGQKLNLIDQTALPIQQQEYVINIP